MKNKFNYFQAKNISLFPYRESIFYTNDHTKRKSKFLGKRVDQPKINSDMLELILGMMKFNYQMLIKLGIRLVLSRQYIIINLDFTGLALHTSWNHGVITFNVHVIHCNETIAYI